MKVQLTDEQATKYVKDEEKAAQDEEEEERQPFGPGGGGPPPGGGGPAGRIVRSLQLLNRYWSTARGSCGSGHHRRSKWTPVV